MLPRERDARLMELELLLRDVQRGVDRNATISRGVEGVMQRIWPAEAMAALRTGIERVTPYLRFLAFAPRVTAGVLVTCFFTRGIIYRRVADESADLARQVLDRNEENLTSTLEAVARNEDTLRALVDLLKQLLDAKTTRSALIELLVEVFQDEQLLHKTGIFALEALDTTDARKMLDTQVARLVSAAVLDQQVQHDTAMGVRGALKRAVWDCWWDSTPTAP